MFNQTNEIKDNVHMTDGNFVTYDMCFQCIIYQGLLPSEIKRFIKKSVRHRRRRRIVIPIPRNSANFVFGVTLKLDLDNVS